VLAEIATSQIEAEGPFEIWRCCFFTRCL